MKQKLRIAMFNIFNRVNIPNIGPGEFERILREKENAVLLDVRTRQEFESGHIPGAVHINVQDAAFNEKIEGLDRDAHYLVYCRSGRRSMLACRMMHEKGFMNTYNLEGGILSWPKEII